MNRGWRHVFAHIHAQTNSTYSIMRNLPKALNAGCMINNFAPATLDELVVNNRIFNETH